jgi:hypothetical protein
MGPGGLTILHIPMQLATIAFRRWRGPASRAAARRVAESDDSRERDEEVELLLALPAEGQAELFELREAWVTRLRAAQDIRDRGARSAEQRAALEEFERAKRELFGRYRLPASRAR